MAEAQKPNLSELMKTAQKMQEGMRKAQEALAKMEITGNAGGDMVTVTVNGNNDFLKFKISQEALKEDPEVLADLCTAACNDAIKKVKKSSEELMKKLTQELGLPPDMG